MDFALGLSSISAATSAAKELLKLQEIINSAEAKLKIAEIQLSLADSKTALSSANEKILELETKIKELKTQSQIIDRLERKGELFFDPQENLHKCPNCIEAVMIAMTLHVNPENKSEIVCKKCNSNYVNPNYDPNKNRIARGHRSAMEI